MTDTTRSPLIIPTNATALEILDAIDDWAQRGQAEGYGGSQEHYDATKDPDRQAYHLWVILSALRGPDNGNDEVKRDTTEFIRALTVPHLCAGRANVARGAFATPVTLKQLADGVDKLRAKREALRAQDPDSRFRYGPQAGDEAWAPFHFFDHLISAMRSLDDTGRHEAITTDY